MIAKTKTEMKKTAASTAAQSNFKLSKSYRKANYQSSPNLKEILGVLLLHLVGGHLEPGSWRLFEVLLGQYCEIKQTARDSL